MAFLVPARCVSAALALGLVATVASAEGEPSAAELASARSLFNEARVAEEHGNWAEALAKLDAVAKVKMTPQVRFHLGLCLEHTTRLVEALNNLERATSEATEQNLPMVVEEAKEHAATVRGRVPKLFIVLAPGKDARVEVDGQVVASVLLSRPVAFDPGTHKVVATAPGLSFSREVSIAEREEKRVDVIFSPAPLAAATGSFAARGEPPPANGPVPDAPSNRGPRQWSTLGWVAVGIGGAAVVGAGASALVRKGAIDDIDSTCPGHQDCPLGLESSQSKARTFGALAAVLGVFGGASVVTGVVLLMQPRRDVASGTVALTPWVTATGAGAAGAVSW
jgi:hypothetical protein